MSSTNKQIPKEMANCIILGNSKAEAVVQSCLENLSEEEKMVIESVLKRNKMLQNQITNQLDLSLKIPHQTKKDLTLEIPHGKCD